MLVVGNVVVTREIALVDEERNVDMKQITLGRMLRKRTHRCWGRGGTNGAETVWRWTHIFYLFGTW
jgi:hypothetical protein